MIAGIAACGYFVPRQRLPLALLRGATPAKGGPERSLAWFDEDSVTLAVAAARDCLKDSSRDAIDLVLFATTTYAYGEKQGAAIIAEALGLDATVRTVDVAHSLRGGTQALLAAFDAVSSGSAREALVLVADCRMGAPDSELERNGGDAAAAFLVSGHMPHARLIDTAQHREEIVAAWRRSGERFTHSWEDRFVVQHGYLHPMLCAAGNLRTQSLNSDSSDWQWVLSASDARSHASLVAQLEIGKAHIADPLFGTVGYCGTAHAPLQLVAALRSARTGQSIAVVNQGDGAEALLLLVDSAFAAAAPVNAEALRGTCTQVRTAAQYRAARGMNPTEYATADEPGLSATVHFRERSENLSLVGQRCSCGAPQFPRGRVCQGCGRRDDWQPVSYADSQGSLITYTLDEFFPAPAPPTAAGIVQIDGGPRLHMQITDIAPADVSIGLRLRFEFRRVHQVGGRPNYFWKAVPVRGENV